MLKNSKGRRNSVVRHMERPAKELPVAEGDRMVEDVSTEKHLVCLNQQIIHHDSCVSIYFESLNIFDMFFSIFYFSYLINRIYSNILS